MNEKEMAADDGKRLFKQVYDYVIHRIEHGEWKAHEKLPSIRQLAEELGVHRLTVFRAYQMLKQNEKVYVKEKSGYYVNPNDPDRVVLEYGEDQPIVVSGKLINSLSDIQRVSVVDQFSQALIDPNLLPNLFLSEYVKKVFDMYPKLMGTYSTVQGDEELREVLSRYMMQNHHIQLRTSDIMITTGAQQAIDLLSRIFISPMDAVMIERPTYSAAIDIFRQQRARFVPVDIHPYGYDIANVEMLMKQYKPRFFYMNPTFHNPTGYTVPSSQRKQLVELAERYRCLLIEDDAFHDMYFDGPPPQPLFTYDTEGWVVYLRSFSKYVAPGLRICAIIASPSVMKLLLTAKSLADNGSPLVNQKIFLHYFQSERLQQHIEKLRIALQVRRDIMEKELTPTGWNWVSPRGGLNLWIKLPEVIPVEQFLKACMQQSISFVPGIICDPLRKMQSQIRLSYSFINEKQLQQGVKNLVNVADRYR
ncbi:aminotransferase-like domain-containing protein [Paenibacillus alba]|uniref:PLP-dependent aminotransferase family protein n=1 Tax=Paenibacillus alba TaxID=1197127 RepID=A0ABU6GG66_9BACL|nr:PLP-dependent aminotransferase family protein [Paenibacillus alba]MEC0231733.1 PLP-dependent aminotransferase family protein [Paenibacillus alba]